MLEAKADGETSTGRPGSFRNNKKSESRTTRGRLSDWVYATKKIPSCLKRKISFLDAQPFFSNILSFLTIVENLELLLSRNQGFLVLSQPSK